MNRQSYLTGEGETYTTDSRGKTRTIKIREYVNKGKKYPYKSKVLKNETGGRIHFAGATVAGSGG